MKKLLSLGLVGLFVIANFSKCIFAADSDAVCNNYATVSEEAREGLLQLQQEIALRGPVTPDNPYEIPDINYSTGLRQYIEIPWKQIGGVALWLGGLYIEAGTLKAIMAALGTVFNFNSPYGPRLYVGYTQYSSKGEYYSSYSNSYYHKAINLGITFYAVDENGKRVICGPYDGDWFDPIRPRSLGA